MVLLRCLTSSAAKPLLLEELNWLAASLQKLLSFDNFQW